MRLSIEQSFQFFTPIVESLGLSLVDVEWVSARPGSRLSVIVARPGATISIADCEAVTRAIEREIETNSAFQSAYALEVSSPGLDRVIKRPHEYNVFCGRQASLWLSEPIEGAVELFGELLGTLEGKVLLRLVSGEKIEVDLSQIRKAKLVFDRK